jgi:hypothetical protein
MAIQTRGVFPDLYDNVDKMVYALLGKQLKELPPIWPAVYIRKTSDRKFERYTTVAPFGEVPPKPEGAPYQFDLIKAGWTKDVTPVEYGLGFEVTQTALEDDQYDVLTKNAQWLSFSARATQERVAAAPYNNGFSTELSADGVSLFNTAHPLAGGGAARNKLATPADLSFDSLAQALTDVQVETKLESGQLVAPVQSWILYVPPALEFLAERIINSTQIPGSNDNDINSIKSRSRIRLVVNPYLTDLDAWFLVASDNSHGMCFLDRVGITAQPADQDPRTGNRLYKVRARFTAASTHWQGVFASEGA